MRKQELQEFTDQFSKLADLVVVMAGDIRELKEMVAQKQKEREDHVLEKEDTFASFMKENNLAPLYSFEGRSVAEMYFVYYHHIDRSGRVPISKNKFSRLVHELGYETRVKKVAGKQVRSFFRTI